MTSFEKCWGYPEERMQYSELGESLKSTVNYAKCVW